MSTFLHLETFPNPTHSFATRERWKFLGNPTPLLKTPQFRNPLSKFIQILRADASWNEVQTLQTSERLYSEVWSNFCKVFSFGSYNLIIAPIGGEIWHGGVLHAKFHPHRCNVNLKISLWVTYIPVLFAAHNAAGNYFSNDTNGPPYKPDNYYNLQPRYAVHWAWGAGSFGAERLSRIQPMD